MAPTHIQIDTCLEERGLRRGATDMPDLALDLLHVRQEVAIGSMNPLEGVVYILGGGEITQTAQEELHRCLGAISRGSCPLYPVVG